MRFSVISMILPLSAISFSYSVSAQKTKDQYFLFDASFKATEVNKAVYFMRLKMINDTAYQWDTYHIMGPMIRSVTTRDKEGLIGHGETYFYKPGLGTIDSVHNYYNGLAEGTWYYFNDTGRAYLGKVYAAGNLIRTIDYFKEDSIKKEQGKEEKYEVEKESEFRGGLAGWGRFLDRTLKYPDRALDAGVGGLVCVQFIVDAEGNIVEPRIYKSVEFSIDEEALRLLRVSLQ